MVCDMGVSGMWRQVVCGGQWYVVVSVVWGQWYGISTVCGVSGLSRSVVVCEINGEVRQ